MSTSTKHTPLLTYRVVSEDSLYQAADMLRIGDLGALRSQLDALLTLCPTVKAEDAGAPVRACNAHEGLVDIAREVLEFEINQSTFSLSRLVIAAKTALAAAEGGVT